MATTWTDQSGYLTNTELSKKFYYSAQPMFKFRQFTDVKTAFGKHSGQTVNWMRVANLGTYGGTLTETSSMIESSQAYTWGTVTVNELGNSIPFTFKISALSKFEIDKIIKQGLRDDMVKCIDGSVEREFNSCALRYVGSSTTTYALTTNGTATASNTSILNTYHIRNMMLELKKRNVPGFSSADGDYAMIVSVDAASGLMGALESIYQYTDTGTKKLLNGEIGRYFGCRFVEDSFASRYTYSASARTATAKSWAQAQSLDGYMFGAETVQEIVAVPEEIRMKETTDYGRSNGIAWYMIAGWKIMWEPSGTGVPDTRIIKWDSAG